MNFCSNCGTDLREAAASRFCFSCGHQLAQVAVTIPAGGSAGSSEGLFGENRVAALKALVFDLGSRFSYKTTPNHVSDFHRCPPLDVEEDSDFDAFDDGSCSTDSSSVVFELPFADDPRARIMYRFEQKEYRFYGGNDVYVDGLRSAMILLSESYDKSDLHEQFGPPTETILARNFTSYDKWSLPTPKSGGYLPEQFIVAYDATAPDRSSAMWIDFPEHV